MKKERPTAMADDTFDLLVVGGGSGGVAAARRAAEHGAKVAICEDRRWGGTCVHRGCVPKKLLVYAAEFGAQRRFLEAYGWSAGSGSGQFDWADLRDRIARELERLQRFYVDALENAGVTRIEGFGRLLAPGQVQVGERTYRAAKVLLATGGEPWVPSDLEGAELGIVSDQVFTLENFPARLLVVGSGYIGTEFAGVFRGLGAEVDQVFRSEWVLPGFDGELRCSLQEQMARRGVNLRPETGLRALESEGGGAVRAHLNDGTSELYDQVLLATGRRPRFSGLGLEEVGIELDAKGKIEVDSTMQTTLADHYALGDCVAGFELTPVAIAQGRALAAHLFDGKPYEFEESLVPTAVFSSPPAASVGLTEEELRERGVSFRIYRSSFRPMKVTLPDLQERALLKLLVDEETDRVLGCHLVAEEAPELIQVLAVALSAGATKADFDRTVAVHPTLAEELVLMRHPAERITTN